MSFAAVFIISRFFYRIYEFIRHWYWGGFLSIARKTLAILESWDRILAIKVTLRYIFRPLYQDYSIIGYILGFIFRMFRLAVGVLIYGVVVALAAGIYACWALLPFYLIYWVTRL